MNFKKYITKIAKSNLNNKHIDLCLFTYKYGYTIHPSHIIINEFLKYMEKLNLIETTYLQYTNYMGYGMTNKARHELDFLLLHHSEKQQWTECLEFLYPNIKINNTLYPKISFLSKQKTQEDFLAYWSDTLKIGHIIHPEKSNDNNYNEYMTTLILQSHLDCNIIDTKNEKNQYIKFKIICYNC